MPQIKRVADKAHEDSRLAGQDVAIAPCSLARGNHQSCSNGWQQSPPARKRVALIDTEHRHDEQCKAQKPNASPERVNKFETGCVRV